MRDMRRPAPYALPIEIEIEFYYVEYLPIGETELNWQNFQSKYFSGLTHL